MASHEIFTDESGKFWGNAGAGGLFYAQDTGRVLVQKRSPYVNEPGTWGVWGGAIDGRETPEKALSREVKEEAGYTGGYTLEHVYTFKSGKFRYSNFLIIVPHEFEPKHSWESSGHEWTDIGNIPNPVHFGLKEALPYFKRAIHGRGSSVAASVKCAISALNDCHELLARDLGRHKVDKFYVVIPILDDHPKYKKMMQDLSRGVLDGVKGISESSQIIMQWYGMARDGILVMDANKMMKMNSLSRIQYDNLHYIMSNGMAALYRIFDKDDSSASSRGGLAQNIVDHIGYTTKIKGGDSKILKDAKSLSKEILTNDKNYKASLNKLTSDQEERNDIVKITKDLWYDDLERLIEVTDKAAKDIVSFADHYDGVTSRTADLYLDSSDLPVNFDMYDRVISNADEIVNNVSDYGYNTSDALAMYEIIESMSSLIASIRRMDDIREDVKKYMGMMSYKQKINWGVSEVKKALKEDFEKNGTSKINSLKDLSKRLNRAVDSYDAGYRSKDVQGIPKNVWDTIVVNAIENISSTYKSENEWLVKDNKLKVPKGSLLYVTGKLLPRDVEKRRKNGTLTDIDKDIHWSNIERANLYDEMIQKYRLNSQYKVRRIDQKKMRNARDKWVSRS